MRPCGPFPGRTRASCLPPAIRPGLHCGRACWDSAPTAPAASPGHQAGAPLRRDRRGRDDHRDQRPSPGHQAGAPLRRVFREAGSSEGRYFPRPSGRGSIAASSSRSPPPQAPRPTSPGHQAGAPLRPHRVEHHIGVRLDFPRPSGRGSIAASYSLALAIGRVDLPPAIRPGLHCGASAALKLGAMYMRLPPAIRPGLHCGWRAS